MEQLRENHEGRMINIRPLNDLTKGLVEKYEVIIGRAVTQMKEAMVYIQYMLKKDSNMKVDCNSNARLLGLPKMKEIYETYDAWKKFIDKKRNKTKFD